MTIRFDCPICKSTYTAADQDAGKKYACAKCAQRLQVPAPQRNRTVLGEVRESAVPPPVRRRTEEPALPPLPPVRRRRTPAVVPIVLIMVGGFVLLGVGVLILVLIAHRSKELDQTPAAKGKEPTVSKTKEPPSVVSKPKKDRPKPRVEEEEEPPVVPMLPAGPSLTGEQVYERLVGSSVIVLVGKGMGTGVVVDRDRGLIVTNYHVVLQANTASVVFPIYDEQGELITDANRYRPKQGAPPESGEIVAREPTKDLALIRVAKLPDRTAAAPIAAKAAATGSTVFSVGGSGVEDNLVWRLTRGTVRGRSKRTQQMPFGRLECVVLETDAPLNRGDSGGPIMNDRGELVAVVSHGSKEQNSVSGNIDAAEIRDFIARHRR